jgi:hypothetical protein
MLKMLNVVKSCRMLNNVFQSIDLFYTKMLNVFSEMLNLVELSSWA